MTVPPDDLHETGQGVGFRADACTVAPDLAPFLMSFHSYHTRVDPGLVHEEIFLPALPAIRLQTYGQQWGFSIGGRSFDPVPQIALFGPSAHAGRARVATGQLIGVYLKPSGWARLIGVRANEHADSVAALESLWGAEASALGKAVSAHDDFTDQVAAFEDWLRARLAGAKASPPILDEIEAVLADSGVGTVEDALSRLGIEDWRFARIAKKHVGFTPKLLMRRARFMRTILRIREQGDRPWAQLVDEAYVDQSHFIRDCREFLDMTPVQFANRFQPIAHGAFDARERAMGQPHHLITGEDE